MNVTSEDPVKIFSRKLKLQIMRNCQAISVLVTSRQTQWTIYVKTNVHFC